MAHYDDLYETVTISQIKENLKRKELYINDLKKDLTQLQIDITKVGDSTYTVLKRSIEDNKRSVSKEEKKIGEFLSYIEDVKQGKRVYYHQILG